MQELHSLLHSFTSGEGSSFRNYLSCFTTYNKENLKQLQLAELLMNEKEPPTHDACCIKLYGTKHDHSFDDLKYQLKEKALDFLLSDISCDKKKELDEADYAIIRMKKKSAQFQHLFFSKTRIFAINYLLDDIIREAKKYEQYSMLAEHLKYKKTIVSWKQGKAEFEKTNAEMQDAAKRLALYNKAEHYYYELNMMNEYNGRQDEKRKLQWLQKVIAEIDTENKNIKSPHVNYSLKFLELEYYQLKKNYAKARSVCTEWLDIVMDNKSVYRRQRLGVVYDNLSRCEFYLQDYTQAAKDAREAQKYFNAGSENYCIALEQEFYALFAMEQYNEAIDMAEKMISSATRKELGEFRDAKYHYLLANALFKKERFREALNLLSQERELSQDKAGWEIGRRTLKIMTLVEKNQLDEAGLTVHSLKQFFSRTETETPISPRDKIILKLLLMAERKGFAFNTLTGGTDKYMSKLKAPPQPSPLGRENISSPDGGEPALSLSKGQEGALAWQPFTHEVFPFHEWFAGKLKINLNKVTASSEKLKVMVMK